MPANHHIDNKAKLIITTWEGVAIDSDFIEALKKYQKDIQSKPDYLGYNELVNFNKVLSIKLTVEGLKNIGQLASRTDQNRVNTKLALVASSDLAYGLARMYEAYRSFAQNTNKELRVFKEESEALEWLQSNT